MKKHRKFFSRGVFLSWGLFLVLIMSGCTCKHEFGEWVVTQPATCTEEGTLTRNCSNCDETESASLPVEDHSFGNWITTQESTCTVAGTQTRTCSVCGVSEECEIALAPHTFGEWEVTTQATCTTPGVQSSVCSLCGASESRDTPVAEHNFSWTTITAATCTSSGSKTGTCAGCGLVQETTVDATGHNWSSATCLKPKTCKSCGLTEGTTSNHSWNAASCTKAKACSVCGTTEGTALGHQYGSSGACSTCGNKMVSIKLKIPSIGTFNGYASLVVTNYTDSTITFPTILSINGKTCNSDNGYQVGAGQSATLSYYRAIIPSQRYDDKHYDMYLDNNSIGYCVITWNGTQYYAEYGVNGLTTFYRGNVNGPA